MENQFEKSLQTNTIILSVGNDTNNPQEIVLAPDGFYYNGEKVEDVHNIYEKFSEIVKVMYGEYKANKLIK